MVSCYHLYTLKILFMERLSSSVTRWKPRRKDVASCLPELPPLVIVLRVYISQIYFHIGMELHLPSMSVHQNLIPFREEILIYSKLTKKQCSLRSKKKGYKVKYNNTYFPGWIASSTRGSKSNSPWRSSA